MVRVQAADDPATGDSLMLRFAVQLPQRPYREHISGQRLQDARLKRQLTQKQAADGLLANPNIPELSRLKHWQLYIGKVENEKWDKAPDELYTELAELYGVPLSSLQKQ